MTGSSGLWATKWICAIGVAGSAILTALDTGGIFAEAAKIKDVALPCVYLILLVCALQASKGPRIPQPGYMIWVPTLLTCVLASTVSGIAQRTHLSVVSLLQDLLMLGALAFASLAALHVPSRSVPRIVECFTLTGIPLAAMKLTLPPFSSLTVPAVFAAFYLRKEHPEAKLWKWAPWVGLFLVFRAHFGFGRGEPSGNVMLQYLTCGGILLLMSATRRLRLPFFAGLMLAATAVAGVVLFTTAGQQLAGTGGEVDDVTIKQRLYEMAAVQEAVHGSSMSLLLGLGPGSTVNLSGSPDASTLIAAGRHLSAVDDVHLLTADLILKLGFAGIAWLFIVFGCIIAAAWKVATDPSMDRVSVALIIFIIGSLAYGAPAATNFLANPLFGFFFGLLVARRRAAARSGDTPETPSRSQDAQVHIQ